jgi:LPXTG-site transpeptidase (sortase) family protein
VPGNFAVAGHRQTRGAVLDSIDALVPGDRIYVQTRDGFYTYVFRNSEIVLPDRTDVLLPVPAQPAATPSESYLTMTSCNPRFGSQERFVAYARLEQWQPGAAGPPAEIAVPVCAPCRKVELLYAWIFSHLPGSLWLRVATGLVLIAAGLVLMVQFLFPWTAQFTQFTDSTIGSAEHP